MLETLFYGGIALLLLSAAIPLVIARSDGRARKASFILSILGSVLLLILSSLILLNNEKIVLDSFQTLPGLGFSFLIDRLAAFFIAVISIVSISVSIYSIQYVEHEGSDLKRNLLASFANIFILSMALVVSSANTYSFLMFWELMSLSSFLLVLYDYEKTGTRKAGLFYFIMTQMSTAFLLLAFMALYHVTGSFDIMVAGTVDPAMINIIFLSLFIGFGIKAGVIPFHKWLPYAHPASPSNISALMSGIMIKVAIYGMMRFLLFVLSPEMWWGILILIAGTVSALLGVVYALKEHDIKRLLAYHSIENIGIILIGLGLYIIFSVSGLPELATLSLLGSLFHTLNHALFKSLLFLTAGSVANATKERNIEEMGGLITRMPYTSLLFLIGAVSISGLPPFNGFVSELMIFLAFLQSYQLANPFLEVLLLMSLSAFALTSALAAACFVKAYGITFLALPRSENAAKAHEAGKMMLLGPAIPALLCIFLGLFSREIFSLAGFGEIVPDILVIGLFMLLMYVSAAAVLYFISSKKMRVHETWGCGYRSLNGRTEYTASGYSQPIVRFFSIIYRTKEIRSASFYDPQGSVYKEGSGEIHLFKFFEEYLYLPLARMVNSVSFAVSRLQNWNLDTYIAYAFIAVIALFIYIGWFI